ncbi:uncharacterized protein LOC121374958 [Gigantopelta aegis]|uniref:uncharacterized protein LOC121374958 n=1 Tax=Gigantopelta aegis TaxID=1735272 RepID=UPI001B88AEA3|nr:uncharacterized protein LOC121374958 [Gigantopelta aegis]
MAAAPTTTAEDAENAVTSLNTTSPTFEWREDKVDVEYFQNDDTLPSVVRFEETDPGKLSPGLRIYAKQPVQLYTRTHKKVARARTIMKDKEGTYFEVGQTLLIPEDYEGWFELVPSDFCRASCFRSIAQVAEAMPRKFFTRSNLKAIRVAKDENGEQKFLERKISSGTVLSVDGLFAAKWRTSAQTGVFKKKSQEWVTTEVKYLKCLDSDQKEVLLPLSHSGKFNAIYERGHLNQNSVYRMKDIVCDLKLPIKARLLYGKAPVVPCIFTGMLMIRSMKEDDCVVGSTVLNKRNVLFEVPVDTPCSVQLAARPEEFTDLSSYKDAQKLCKKYALSYSSMIKLSPDLDTDQKTIQHIPADPAIMRKVDDALKALDLITDISLTDESQDYFMESETDSAQSDDLFPMPLQGSLFELKEFRSRESHTHV